MLRKLRDRVAPPVDKVGSWLDLVTNAIAYLADGFWELADRFFKLLSWAALLGVVVGILRIYNIESMGAYSVLVNVPIVMAFTVWLLAAV